MITPKRLDSSGEPLPGSARHFHKRSISPEDRYNWWDGHPDTADQSPQTNRGFLENATYSFEAFGEKFHLNLTHDREFISESFVLEFIGDGSSGLLDDDTPTHCFYSGQVNGHPQSSAVLSLCMGMVSYYTI